MKLIKNRSLVVKVFLFFLILFFLSLVAYYFKLFEIPADEEIAICDQDDLICQLYKKQLICGEDCQVVGLKQGSSFVDFGSTGDDNFLRFKSEDLSYLSEIKTEQNVTFREIFDRKTIRLKLPALEADKNILLEVRYRDNFDENLNASTGRNYNKPRLESLFTDDQRVDLGILGFGRKNDGLWKTEHVLLNDSEYQRLKSVNGYYEFDIVMPNKNIGNLSIDYLSLISISEKQSNQFKQYLIDRQGFVDKTSYEIDLISEKVWFSRDLSQPVYFNSRPRQSDQKEKIFKTLAKNEAGWVQVSVITPEEINNVSIIFQSDKNIPNPDIFQTYHDYKRIGFSDVETENWFALVPDRLQPVQNTIYPQKTTTYWIKFNKNRNLPPGIINGKLIINSGKNAIFEIPYQIMIGNYSLELAENNIFVYADPRSKRYSSDEKKVYADIGNHLVGIRFPVADHNTISITKVSENVLNFDTKKFEEYLQQLVENKLIGNSQHLIYLILHEEIATLLGLDSLTLYEKFSNQYFVSNYQNLIQKLNKIALDNGVEFVYSVVDEPSNNERKRVIADRLLSLIKKNNNKTWATYYYKCDYDITSSTYSPKGTVIPALSSLVDYKVYNWRLLRDSDVDKKDDGFGYYTTFVSQNRNPSINRFLSGYYLYATNASAVGVYAYGDYTADPYNDFDAPWYYVKGKKSPDFLLSYPSNDGVMIPTLAFEGLREGIIDLSYISTLEKLLGSDNDLKASVSEEAKNFLLLLKTKIPLHPSEYIADMTSLDAADRINAKFSFEFQGEYFINPDQIRERLGKYILLLSENKAGEIKCNYDDTCQLDAGENETNCSDCQKTKEEQNEEGENISDLLTNQNNSLLNNENLNSKIFENDNLGKNQSKNVGILKKVSSYLAGTGPNYLYFSETKMFFYFVINFIKKVF